MAPSSEKTAYTRAGNGFTSASATSNDKVVSRTRPSKSRRSDLDAASLSVSKETDVEDDALQCIEKPDTNDVLLGRGAGA
jgi:hypothetical protein